MLNLMSLDMVSIPVILILSTNCVVALAVDMTARNLQDQAKKRGLPWAAAKGFDTFTPIG
jgi:2-keto-4-pentenoate hydratase/2-oxohepta-3-ene-1,7-dioic acid hydratase in catechol pathway